jgi:NADPH2:quinone reductase
VSAPALPDTLALVRSGGTVCYTGALSGEGTIHEFSPFSIPTGVRLTSYAGGATDLSPGALADYLDAIESGSLEVVLAGVYSGLDEVKRAHEALESGHGPGKHVVVLGE